MMSLSIRQALYLFLIIIAGFILSTMIFVSMAFADNGFWSEQEKESVSSISSKHALSNHKIQSINVSGSTTVSNVLNILADRFEQNHKNIRIDISGGGSSSAVTAMLAHPETIGQMSRAMKPEERNAFVKHYGYEPIEFKIAVDALAVYVNKNNPVKQLTSKQLTDIFSKKNPHINTWGDLHLTVVNTPEWQKQVIQIYTLPFSSGAYSLFDKKLLNKAG